MGLSRRKQEEVMSEEDYERTILESNLNKYRTYLDYCRKYDLPHESFEDWLVTNMNKGARRLIYIYQTEYK